MLFDPFCKAKRKDQREGRGGQPKSEQSRWRPLIFFPVLHLVFSLAFSRTFTDFLIVWFVFRKEYDEEMGFVSYCGCGRCRRRKRGGHGIIKHQLYGRLWFNIWFGPYTFTPLPLVPCSSCAHCFYRFLCKVH